MIILRPATITRNWPLFFSIPRDDVGQLSLSRLRGERPTEQLIRLLNYRWPEMTMKTFEKKCEEMKRLDVVTYIRKKRILIINVNTLSI